ncbi:sulfatase-like hydrolase/transferase [Streptomyces zaomyceticus]|uniref:sulfatase-like hydrolase/transferase n=1 Tax=Streptomyces zaomyceticus TaxID=68286 RepID=UPI0034222586
MSSRRRLLAGSAATLGLGAVPVSGAVGAPPASAAAARAPEDTTRPPNLVVLADDLGWGELGAYGQKLITTPRVDRLAAEGLRFTDTYATAAVRAPSRGSLLTGLHTGHATVRANPSGSQGSLTATDTTFARRRRPLHRAGRHRRLLGPPELRRCHPRHRVRRRPRPPHQPPS